ncbi:MAG: SdrD B-like domain-containing protein, partial [Bacteroidota bacterium]
MNKKATAIKRMLIAILLLASFSYSAFAQKITGEKKVTDHTSIAKVTSHTDGVSVTYTNPYTNAAQSTFAGAFDGTLNSTAKKFYCIDLTNNLATNEDYWDEGTTPSKVTHVLNNYYPYKTGYAGAMTDMKKEAAAIQIAIWHFMDNLNANTVTDAAIKTRALAIIADANANHANVNPLQTLQIIPANQSVQQGSPATFIVKAISLAGTPVAGLAISLSTTAGTLSTSAITTGANGETAAITLNNASAAMATVKAKATVEVPHGTRYVHKNSPNNKQKLVLATPAIDIKEVTTKIEFTACLNKIGDFVWHDKNVNGIQDAGEPGISGVVVELVQNNAIVASATTDANGKYEFTSRPSGSYSVRVAASNFTSSGVLFSTAQTKWYAAKVNQGTDDTKDSDAALNGSVSVNLSCADNLTIDFGFYKTAVTLKKTANKTSAKPGDVITYTFTIENTGDIVLSGGVDVFDPMFDAVNRIGHFTPVNPGDIKSFTKNYTVKTTDCGNIVNTAKAVGHPIDSSPKIEQSSSVTVAVDCNASLGDKVWKDTNKNGIQDAGETGVAGVTVKLYTCADALVATTTTNSSGNYIFGNLAPGDYYVVFVKPNGMVFTTANAGTNDAVDSDADAANGKTSCTTLTAGENDLTWDAGVYDAA